MFDHRYYHPSDLRYWLMLRPWPPAYFGRQHDHILWAKASREVYMTGKRGHHYEAYIRFLNYLSNIENLVVMQDR